MDKQRLQKLAGIVTETYTPDMFGPKILQDIDTKELIDPIVRFIASLWDNSDEAQEAVFAEIRRRVQEELQRIEVEPDEEGMHQFKRDSGPNTMKRLYPDD